jgi:hypothetical protein
LGALAPHEPHFTQLTATTIFKKPIFDRSLA